MYNRKRRPAERQLIKIMDIHLVTKARNMDEKDKRRGGGGRGRSRGNAAA